MEESKDTDGKLNAPDSGENDLQKPLNRPDYTYFTLDNGLKVVLHRDCTQPRIAVNIHYHVGSSREQRGKTGIAHLIEHLMFRKSEHLPLNSFEQNISIMSGSRHAYTHADRTVLSDLVPRDALEKIIWMESDRMGYFINSITQQDINSELKVIINEYLGRFINKPYEYNMILLREYFYPSNHPYNWLPIGRLNDLMHLTLADVMEYYERYYTPNNASLVLVGDMDISLVKELVQKYFGEIKKKFPISKPTLQPVVLKKRKSIVRESENIFRPRITFVFPAVKGGHPDFLAFSFFMNYFMICVENPLKEVLKQRNLASYIEFIFDPLEKTGIIQIVIRALEGVDLNEIIRVLDEYIAKFESEDLKDYYVKDIKDDFRRHYNTRISDIETLADMIAYDTEFRGKPDASYDDLDNYMTLTKEDLINIYKKYFKNKPYFALCNVPKGKTELAPRDAIRVETEIYDPEELNSFFQHEFAGESTIEYTETSFDRITEPDYLPNTPIIEIPEVWSHKLKNGIRLFGITLEKTEEIEANLIIKGGMLFDPAGKSGLSYLNAELMNEGTATRSSVNLQNAIYDLNAKIKVTSKENATFISISCAVTNFTKVMQLVEEMVLHPRFDNEKLKEKKTITQYAIRADSDSQVILSEIFTHKLLNGVDLPYACPSFLSYGTKTGDIEGITIDDIQYYYKRYINPTLTDFTFIGSLHKEDLVEALSPFVENWTGDVIEIPQPILNQSVEKNRIYCIDFPDSSQSLLKIMHQNKSGKPVDGIKQEIANYPLGNGSNNLLINQLMVGRGFAYSAYAYFERIVHVNHFFVFALVATDTTKETLQIIKNLLENYESTFDEKALDLAKTALLRKRLFAFETQKERNKMLTNIAVHHYPSDYFEQEDEAIKNMTLSEAKSIIATDMNPNELIWLVLGDAKTLLEPLNSLGMGKVIMLDKEGKEIE